MPDQKIFCNSPWYELQIYWDGSLGFCCQESHKIYPQSETNRYNIRNMTIRQWMDSEPMRQARMAMHGQDSNSFCQRCYHEELHSGTSRRIRSNQKSVIFTKTAFDQSYQQSPGHKKFENSKRSQGAYDQMPVDLHIDLGNYCNLTCKMCFAQASSSIAAQHVKWQIKDAEKYLGTDWTRHQLTWHRTLKEISGIENLKSVHFMGGETLITRRFEEFVDHMIAQGKCDINISFVTNGTTFNRSLMDKLSQFQSLSIEVSIETLTDHNAYQRQGTDTELVLSHIEKYIEYSGNNSSRVVIRPAISLLTIGNYDSLLRYCLEKKLVIKSLLCYEPRHYDPVILPKHIKNLYKQKYENLLQELDLYHISTSQDYNETDANQIARIIKTQAMQCIDILTTDTPEDSEQQLEKMVSWCRRWDAVHGLDARRLYPEFQEVLDRYGY